MREIKLTEMRDKYCMNFIYKSYSEGIKESVTCNDIYTMYEVLFKDYEAARNYYRSVLGKKQWPPRINLDNITYSDNSTTTKSYYASQDTKRVLVIGDIHEPFTLEGYMDFCKSTYKKYECNSVVFIGDILDNHYQSFHDSDPDGDSASEEFNKAFTNIQKWYEEFPEAYVCIGNHDLIPNRKAFKAGLSSSWIKSIGEVLNTPNWKFVEEVKLNDVVYTHGTGRKAKDRMRQDMVSIVQGHYHSESYVEYSVGINHKLFAMQVGCGIDKSSYAMAYGKHFAKPHINCGVVLDDGNTPLLVYMNLK